jgi:hypothetical protein
MGLRRGLVGKMPVRRFNVPASGLLEKSRIFVLASLAACGKGKQIDGLIARKARTRCARKKQGGCIKNRH